MEIPLVLVENELNQAGGSACSSFSHSSVLLTNMMPGAPADVKTDHGTDLMMEAWC